MGLVLTVGVAALVLGLLRGGTLAALTRTRVRGGRLLVASLVAQIGAAVLASPDGPAYAVGLALGGVLAAAFVALNLRVPGTALMGGGLLLNAVVVALNGAMPVSLEAAHTAGVTLSAPALAADPRHEPVTPGTRAGWLGDVVPVPSPLRREVVSPGDVAVALGLGWYVLAAMRRDVSGESDSPDETGASHLWSPDEGRR
jgi:hypothetical protein